jgi:class 3 adenylate cyclase
VVALWRERGIAVEHVVVTALRAAAAGALDATQPVAVAPIVESGLGPGFSYEIKAMLFADAVGFSKMSEDQIPIFIRTFMGSVGALNERTAHKPIHMQTSGDGLYFVFRDTNDAGHYALELNKVVRGTDWTALGLPPSFDLRIGLHCGPIFCCEDPVTHTALYTGSHTSRTARIEPITPPGQVYTSSAFAAVAAATGVDDLGFSYIGRIPLAKHYGSLALYHVQSSC